MNTIPIPSKVLFWIGVATILASRLAIPGSGGALPALSVALCAVCVLGFLTRRLSLSTLNMAIFAAFVVYAVCLTSLRGGSFYSVALVAVVWFPVIFRAAWSGSSLNPALRGLLTATVACSAFAALQGLLSLTRGSFIDPISALPQDLLLQGFNTTYPVIFGGSWYHANGTVFLEPSLLSLYATFAVIALLEVTRINRASSPLIYSSSLVALVSGLLMSVAVSGLVLAPLLVFSLFRRRGGVALGTVALGLGFAARSLPPVDSIVAKALNDPFAATGQVSAAARLYRPYSQLIPLAQDRLAFGSGGGAAHALALQQASVGVENTTPTIVKVLIEYGVVGAVLAAALMTSVLAATRGLGVVVGAAVVMVTLPTDGLTNSLLAPTLLLLTQLQPDEHAAALTGDGSSDRRLTRSFVSCGQPASESSVSLANVRAWVR